MSTGLQSVEEETCIGFSDAKNVWSFGFFGVAIYCPLMWHTAGLLSSVLQFDPYPISYSSSVASNSQNGHTPVCVAFSGRISPFRQV